MKHCERKGNGIVRLGVAARASGPVQHERHDPGGGVGCRDVSRNMVKRGRVWHIRYDIPPGEDGKRRQKRETCRHDDGTPMTRREADEKLQRILAEISVGVRKAPTQNTTVESHFVSWLDRQRKRLSPATIDVYEIDLRRHILPALGEYEIGKLKPMAIQCLYDDMEDDGYAPKTIRNIHGIVHTALDRAMRLDLIPSNPADRVEVPAARRAQIIIADEAELTRIHAAIASFKYRICVLFAVCAGLRRGEIVALQWRDLDEETAALTVRRAAV